MKKKALLLLPLFIITLLSSCLRADDWDMINSLIGGDVDVEIHASGSPTLGLPIAQTELSIEDLIASIDEDYTHYLTADDELTIVFDTTLSGIIRSTNSSPRAHAQWLPAHKDSPILYSVDTTLDYSLDIDLFNDLTLDDHLNYDAHLGHLWLSLVGNVIADADPAVRQRLASGSVSAIIDSLVITYTDHNGQLHTVDGIHIDPIEMVDIFNGTQLALHDIDLSDIIDAQPSNITAAVRLTLNIHQDILHEDLSNINFNDLLSLLELNSIAYDANLSLRFPLGLNINYLTYADTVDISEIGIDQLQIALDSLQAQSINITPREATLVMKINNGLPLGLRTHVVAIDENNTNPYEIIPETDIQPAVTSPSSHLNGYREASSPTQSTLSIQLYEEAIQNLLNAKQLIFYVTLHTNGQTIILRRQDNLNVKLYAIAGVDITINK